MEEDIGEERERMRSALDAVLSGSNARFADQQGEPDVADSELHDSGQDEVKGSKNDELDRTLFVRGLPRSARQPEIRLAMEAAASAGACVAEGGSSDAAAAAAALVRANPRAVKRSLRVFAVRLVGGSSGRPAAFVEFSNIRGAACALQAPASTLHVASVPLTIARALSGDDARKVAARRALTAKAGKGGEPLDIDSSYADPTDRRRLKLLQEGLITRDMPAAEGVCEHDLALRERLEEEKKLKLRSPYFRVSDKRLAVHNIPAGFTKEDLRKLFINAVKSRAKNQDPQLVQVSLLLEKSPDGRPGKPMGRGFVEFREHQHAIAALRELNNNPEGWAMIRGRKAETLSSVERRPIIGFAIDDVRKLQLQQRRQSERRFDGDKHRNEHGITAQKHDKKSKSPRSMRELSEAPQKRRRFTRGKD